MVRKINYKILRPSLRFFFLLKAVMKLRNKTAQGYFAYCLETYIYGKII